MQLEEATLYAAIVAAIASVAGVVATLLQRRAEEDRAAYRRTFEPFLHELGDAMYQLVACCNILALKEPGEGRENWLQRAEGHRERLMAIRPKLRYPLWGLDNGIRALSRLPTWVGHKRASPDELAQLLKDADRLRSDMDNVVLTSFQKGRPPTWLERRRVAGTTEKLYETFDERAEEENSHQALPN